jgi:hypothetical protein
MRKLFLPFHQTRLFAFHQGISTEPRVLRASYRPFAIAFSFLRDHQPLSATVVISFPIATVS